MAIAQMKRVELVASRSDKYALLNFLQDAGVADLQENPELQEQLEARGLLAKDPGNVFDIHDNQDYSDLMHILRRPESANHLMLAAVDEPTVREAIVETERWQQRVDAVLKTLRPFDDEKKPLFTVRRPQTFADYDAVFSEQERYLSLIEEIEALTNEQRQADESLAAQKSHLNALEPLKEISLPDPVTEGRIRSAAGYFRTEEEYHALLEQAKTANLPLAGKIVTARELQVIALFAWPYSEDERARRLLAESPLQSFPATTEEERKGNFAAAYSRQEKRIEETESLLENLQVKIRTFANEIPNLETLYDIQEGDLRGLRANLKLIDSSNLFMLTGYVPAKAADKLNKELNERFELYATFQDPAEDEDVPSLLVNPEPTRPIEAILLTFSPPSYTNDLDPSFIMMFSYAFFFGSMLSDIGYGLLLAIGCLLGLYKFKAEGGMRQMLKVFLSGAIVSIGFGILYGGFFGNLLPAVTNDRIALPVLWFDPMNEPINLMIWCVVFGAVHLFIAMGLDIYNKVRQGNWYDAAFSVAPWYLIIGGIGLLVLGVPYAMWVIIAGATVILLMSSREKNPIKRLVGGLLGLYSVTGWLSDLLSYTRILALTLATSVIAMVVNVMAAMVGGGGGFRVIFLVLVLLAGHGLNIALSTLSAYVHASRLHYVEFLGRFYEGGGKLYEPLKYEGKYTRLTETRNLPGTAAETTGRNR